MELQMGSYRQLKYEEREKLAELWQSKSSITQIAKALGRCKSTISREVRRNQAPPGQYWPDTAQKLTLKRRQRQCRLDRDDPLREFVVRQLRCHFWTPEQIAGHLKHRQNAITPISHESIYVWIYKREQKKEKLWKFLTRHKAKRGLRKNKGAGISRIPNRISIHARPKAIENKMNFGHWEADLISFLKNSQHAAVVRERTSMFVLSAPLLSKKAFATSDVLIGLMKRLPPEARKSVTYDNGGEFACHERVNKAVGTASYFCDPYASWQKGGVENSNGRLRRDLPRSTDIKNMSQEEFDEVILNYNTTPRKSLGWLTPLEAFNKNLSGVALRA
jgi:IS30 family transposase